MRPFQARTPPGVLVRPGSTEQAEQACDRLQGSGRWGGEAALGGLTWGACPRACRAPGQGSGHLAVTHAQGLQGGLCESQALAGAGHP